MWYSASATQGGSEAHAEREKKEIRPSIELIKHSSQLGIIWNIMGNKLIYEVNPHEQCSH